MGPGAADIAEIVPDLRGTLPDLKTPLPLEPEAARFRLFDSITSFLKNVSQSHPLMLVLDDLHWADQSSLRLLEFVARESGESRLLLVGCYRDTELSRQHTLAETLAQLSREPVFRRQALRGLGQDELGQFIEATTGVQLSQELTGTLYAHTEGNPFFMTEVIRLLSDSGEMTSGHIGTSEGLKIPEGVREVIGQRLNRLSELCNQVLTTASIIGREFDFNLLIRLIGEGPEDRVLEAVEEALAARVIEEPPGTMDRYQFTHALIQETLAQELSTTRRVRLHAPVAEALEVLYGDDAEAHAAELARHFAEAQTLTGPQKLARYSLPAGEQALAAYAFDEALAHFERGLAARDIALTGAEAASDDEAAEAAETVVAAAPPPLPVLSARVALGLVAVLRGEADAAGEQYQFLQRHRGIVVPGVLRSVDRLLGILSQTMGNFDQAAEHFEDALTYCRNAGYKPELAWSCCDYGDLLLAGAHGPSTGSGRTGRGDRAITLLERRSPSQPSWVCDL